MKITKVLLVWLLLLCCAVEFASGQSRKAGINAAAFLKVGVGARSIGMGSAVTSLSEDVTNMYWNPAGIALNNDRMQAAFSYNSWIASIKQNAVAASYNIENVGTFGIGVVTFGISGIPADRDIYPNNPILQAQQQDFASGDTYDYMDLVAQATYARYVTDKLSLGVTFKFINEKIDDRNASTIAFDFGSLYHIGILNWNIGARINNLGGDIKFYDYAYPIPLTFSIGTSMTPISVDNHSVLVALDAVKPQDGQQYFFSGLEYNFDQMVFLRAGWKFNYSYFGLTGSGIDEGSSVRSSLQTSLEKGSMGAGVRLVQGEYTFRVDYSYTVFQTLDSVHRLSLHMSMK